MRGSTFLLRPSSFDSRNAGKISLFVSLSRFSLSIRFSPSLMFASPPFFLSFLSPFLIPRTSLLWFFLLLISFSFYIFSFLSFSLLFLFLFSFFFSSPFLHFLFSIYIFYYHQPNVPKVGKLPPTFLHCHLSSSQFFFIFISFFLLHLTIGSM